MKSIIPVAMNGLAEGAERERAVAFLRSEGYARQVSPADRVFAAWHDGNVVAAVRLSAEQGVTVLRGMRVHRDVRRRGIGSQLLGHLADVLGDSTCYCVPFAWLTGFYGGIGFVQVDVSAAPAFLSERHALYVEQGLNMVIMRRPG